MPPSSDTNRLAIYRTLAWIPMVFDIFGLIGVAAGLARAALGTTAVDAIKLGLTVALAVCSAAAFTCGWKVQRASAPRQAGTLLLLAYLLTFGGAATTGWLASMV